MKSPMCSRRSSSKWEPTGDPDFEFSSRHRMGRCAAKWRRRARVRFATPFRGFEDMKIVEGWMRWITRLGRQSRRRLMALTFFLVLLIGATDYITGYEISFSVFYL